MNRITTTLALSAACSMLFTAVVEAQPAFDRAKTVIIANAGQINTLDPMRGDYAQTNLIANTLYDTLVTFDYDSKLTPALANSFTLAPDVKSVRISLKPGLKFHDGSPITSADVAYTLDRMKRLGLGLAAQVEVYDRTEIEDDLDFTLHLENPSATFLGALSKVYILNSKLVAANAGADDGQGWLQSHSAGSGAYRLTGQQGQNVLVSQNDSYWNKAAGRPQTIVFRRIDETATQRDELRAGNVDLAIIGMGYRDAAQLDAEGRGIKDARLNTSIQTNVVFNTSMGPTADPRVRKAIRLAYDYEGGLANVRLGNGVIANGVLPSTMPCRPDLSPVKQDLAEAKRLLTEAGVPHLQLTMKFQPVLEAQRLEATLLQSNLREIGVTLTLEPITFPAWLASLRSFDTIPQMMLMEEFPQYPDPGAMLQKAYKSTAVGTNRGAYANPAVDKLLDEAERTADDTRRCDLYKQVQVILDNDSVMLTMYTVGKPVPYRTQKLAGVRASPVTYPIVPADLRLVPAP